MAKIRVGQTGNIRDDFVSVNTESLPLLVS